MTELAINELYRELSLGRLPCCFTPNNTCSQLFNLVVGHRKRTAGALACYEAPSPYSILAPLVQDEISK